MTETIYISEATAVHGSFGFHSRADHFVSCPDCNGTYSTLTKWLKDFRESGDIPVRGSGNYKQSQNSPKYQSTINHSLKSREPVCCKGI